MEPHKSYYNTLHKSPSNIQTKTNFSGRTHRMGNKHPQPNLSCKIKHDRPILSFPNINILVLLIHFLCPQQVLTGRQGVTATKGLRKRTILNWENHLYHCNFPVNWKNSSNFYVSIDYISLSHGKRALSSTSFENPWWCPTFSFSRWGSQGPERNQLVVEQNLERRSLVLSPTLFPLHVLPEFKHIMD